MVSICLFSWLGCRWEIEGYTSVGLQQHLVECFKAWLTALFFFFSPPNVKYFYVAPCLVRSRAFMGWRTQMCVIFGQVCRLYHTLSRWGTLQSTALLPLVDGFLLPIFPFSVFWRWKSEEWAAGWDDGKKTRKQRERVDVFNLITFTTQSLIRRMWPCPVK